MAKFIAFVETRYIGSRVEVEFEVPDDELEGLSDVERDNLLSNYARDYIADEYEWGFYPAKEES